MLTNILYFVATFMKIDIFLKKTNDEYYHVGTSSYIFMCVNALKPDHRCMYALCGYCYKREQNEISLCRKRKRSPRKKDDKMDCEGYHPLYQLNEVCDGGYFSENYLANARKSGANQAKNCVQCWKKFINEKIATV